MENKVIVRRLLAIVKPYRTRMFLSFLAMAGTAVTEPALGKAMEQVSMEDFARK